LLILATTMAKWKPKTTWRDKLEKEHPNHGKIVDCPEVWAKGKDGATMLIPVPMNIDELVRKIPSGSLTDMSNIRQRLAGDAGADIACPMTTGIFLKFVALAAEEDRVNELEPAPYWRLLKDGGKLNPKYPGGVDDHAALLIEEGHEILLNRKGRPAKVADYEESIFIFC
jgi:hypothetical protein